MNRFVLVLLLAVAGGLNAPTAPAQAIQFSNESKTAGTFMQPRAQSPDAELAKGEWPPEKTDPAYYAWPFDVLFLDINGDGHLDLFMVNHAHNSWSRLWLGDGKGKLALVEPARMLAPGKSRGSFSLLAYDFGGGSQDLLITDGDVTGSQYHYGGAAEKTGVDAFAWTKQPLHGPPYTYLLADFNGDGFVDAAVGANRGAGGKIYFGAGQPAVKDFKEGSPAFVGFHSAAADMNGDGWPDIVPSNFGETRQKTEFYLGLLINDGKGNFQDTAAQAGLDAAPAGGNIILADFNNDGLMDIYVFGYPSTKKNEGSVKLYLNLGDGKFKDATKDSGLEGPAGGWSTRYVKCTAADFDNDGLIDIVNYGSTGYRLYHNLGGGKFEDVTETAGLPANSSGEPCASAADFDEDGRVDLALLSDGVWLGRNTTETKNGWLNVRLTGGKGNPEAAGASVTLYKASHLGERDAILGHQQAIFSTDFHTTGAHLHFGLAGQETCDLRALYPGGKPVDRKGLKARDWVTIHFEEPAQPSPAK